MKPRVRPFLWLLLTIPAVPLLLAAANARTADWEDLLDPSGTWSARFLVLALMITPLRQLGPRAASRWLGSIRRPVGVAAFLYALLHLGLYLGAMADPEAILAEALAIGIWPGWLAFLLLLPLAVTSNDWSIRKLRGGWRRLHRLAYPAALLTLAHWALVHDDAAVALLHFLPLVLLQIARLARSIRSPSPTEGQNRWSVPLSPPSSPSSAPQRP